MLCVALFMRAWIEIRSVNMRVLPLLVALFMRAWIEIRLKHRMLDCLKRRPLHEGVD